jgi:hypothetical protein
MKQLFAQHEILPRNGYSEKRKKNIVIFTRSHTGDQVSIFYFCPKLFLYNIHTLVCLDPSAEK